MYPVASHLTISALHHPPLVFPLHKATVNPSLGLMTGGISLHLNKSMPFSLFSLSRWMKTLSQDSTAAEDRPWHEIKNRKVQSWYLVILSQSSCQLVIIGVTFFYWREDPLHRLPLYDQPDHVLDPSQLEGSQLSCKRTSIWLHWLGGASPAPSPTCWFSLPCNFPTKRIPRTNTHLPVIGASLPTL